MASPSKETAQDQPPPDVSLTGSSRTMVCSMCSRRLRRHHKFWTPYFSSRLLTGDLSLSRRCRTCTEHSVKTVIQTCLKEFGDTRLTCTVFDDARQGNFARLYADLKDGFNVNAKDLDTGRTLLHEAAALGDVMMCEMLLEFGAKVDARSLVTRETPLFTAVANDHFKTTLLLLENGADPELRNKRYSTPLHFAESVEVANLLMEQAGLDAEAADATGATAIQAIRRRAEIMNVGVVDSLVDSPTKAKSRARSLMMTMAATITAAEMNSTEQAIKERRRVKSLLKFLDEKSSALRVRAALKEEAAMARRAKIEREARAAAEQRRAEIHKVKVEQEAKTKLERWTREYQAWRKGEKVVKRKNPSDLPMASPSKLITELKNNRSPSRTPGTGRLSTGRSPGKSTARSGGSGGARAGAGGSSSRLFASPSSSMK